MTNDDAERLYLCLQVLSDKSPVIVKIFNENCRYALSIMLAAKAEEEASTQKVRTLLLIRNALVAPEKNILLLSRLCVGYLY
jgi:hypothetical protein